MKRGLAFAVVCLFLTSGVVLAQERNDPPRRPPQTTPGQPPMPGGFPDHPPLTKALKESDKELRKRAAFAIANIVEDVGGFGLPPGVFGPGGGFGGGRPAQGKIPDPGVVGPSIIREKKSSEEKKND